MFLVPVDERYLAKQRVIHPHPHVYLPSKTPKQHMSSALEKKSHMSTVPGFGWWISFQPTYCWWLKSCTSFIGSLSHYRVSWFHTSQVVIARFQPSTVAHGPERKFWLEVLWSHGDFLKHLKGAFVSKASFLGWMAWNKWLSLQSKKKTPYL